MARSPCCQRSKRVRRAAKLRFCLDAPPRGDTVSVELRCPHGGCAPKRLSAGELTLESGRAECTSGMAVCLEQPPPPRAHLEVTYGVDVPDTVRP